MKRLKRRHFIAGSMALSAVSLAFAARTPAIAQQQSQWFTGLLDGVAVGGYDPVAYFTQGAPRRGDPSIALDHDGATWYFASVENRERFVADPARYAPQYGGYCAYAAAHGATARGEPEQWDIVDGKLYLNFNAPTRETWRGDIPGYIAKADGAWPTLLD